MAPPQVNTTISSSAEDHDDLPRRFALFGAVIWNIPTGLCCGFIRNGNGRNEGGEAKRTCCRQRRHGCASMVSFASDLQHLFAEIEMGITGKQERFARRLADGETQSEAYRSVYSAGSMNDATIWSEASRLARHPEVSARVAELKAQGESVRRMLMLDREETILAQLEHEALTAKTDSARIRALELLGRHAGMFADRVEVERVDRTAAQIEADVRVRLERLGILMRSA